eukprot:6460463-Amphidinium_carterae.1
MSSRVVEDCAVQVLKHVEELPAECQEQRLKSIASCSDTSQEVRTRHWETEQEVEEVLAQRRSAMYQILERYLDHTRELRERAVLVVLPHGSGAMMNKERKEAAANLQQHMERFYYVVALCERLVAEHQVFADDSAQMIEKLDVQHAVP